MTYWETLLTIHQHFSLAVKRIKQRRANRIARYIYYVVRLFAYGYIAWGGWQLAIMATQDGYGGYRLIFVLLPLFLIVDYLFRCATTRQEFHRLRPYLLLPLPHYACADYLIFRQIAQPSNLFLLLIAIPFGLHTLTPAFGTMEIVGYIIGFYVLSLINGQFYQLSQTLISHHISYWLLPIVVYPLLFIPFFFVPSVDALFEWAALFAQLVMRGNIAFYLPALLLLTLLFALNRRVVLRHIYYEAYTITAQKKTKRRVLSLNFLEHFEELSEYLKLEVRFIQRNKRMRRAFIGNTCFIIFYLFLTSYSSDASSATSDSILLYCFSTYGIAFLTPLMCYDGNYFECLVMLPNSLYQLLLAKYYFYSALLLIPVLCSVPAVIVGSVSAWTVLAFLLYTAGFTYRILFQMAIYNKVSFPMNASHSASRSNTKIPYMQYLMPFIVLGLPVPIIILGRNLNLEHLSNLLLSLIGLPFILTHHHWLRQINRRMEEQQYDQIAGFRGC